MAGGASSSSSSSSHLNHRKYDVFISFRGEDTRRNFTCHLHGALSRENINAFIDYELHRGDEISESLLGAIEGSYVSVVVFSKNYADSKWCLEELVKIMECRRVQRQVVIPVFYEIDPSHVRNQIGSYKEAFEKHENNSKVETNKVQKWKDALTEAANLAGWDSDSRSYRDDLELIQKIVKDVLQKLNDLYQPHNAEGLVGISTNSAPLEDILREAQSIGIWGMGGIGKTTIAKDLFNKYSRQYNGSFFLENVRERSGDSGLGLQQLRNELYSNLLPQEVCTTRSTFIEHRLRRQRNFIVLDDVSSSEQLENLVGELQSFGPDSRIIITSRDKSLLESAGVKHVYTMKELDDEESLKLFTLKAFKEECPKIGYEEMSRRAIVYCKGIPLALKVLGSSLYSKSEKDWDGALKKIEKIPDKKILNVLRLSYDGLSYQEKQIFLDIACLFKGEQKEHAIDVLNSCSLFADTGMRSLLDKALINISYDCVWMHDLIQEMGWEIVRQESIKNPENRSHLWDFDDICYVLKNNKGTDAIEGMKLDMSQSGQNLRLSSDAFKKMASLKYLKFKCGSLQLPNGLESLSNELRYLEWHGYSLLSLPSNFCAEKLVILRMFGSQFERLWDGVQNLVNLKEVKLIGCKQLTELPDFSQAQKLKIVNLCGCRSLRHVHPSILSLGMLEKLYLHFCVKLGTLESDIHSRSLKYLSVRGCSSLKKFSVSAEEVEDLDLTVAGIQVLGSSIGRFKKVKAIDLSGLRLENLPKELSCLKSLETLKLSGCGQGVSKQNLGLIFNGLQSLVKLYLDKCHHLFELPDNIFHLSSLTELVLDGSRVEKLPESIKVLSMLKTLSLRDCRFLQSLPELPSSICHLDAFNCTLLQRVPPRLFNYALREKHKYVSFQKCVKLDQENSFHQYLSELVCGYQLRRRIGGAEERQPRLEDQLQIAYPGHKVPKWFTYRSKGDSITFRLPPPSDHFLGLLLCVVLPLPAFPLRRYTIGIRWKCRCYLEDVGKHIYSIDGVVFERGVEETQGYHVCISYDSGRILEKTNACRANNQSASKSYNPEVTFQFFGKINFGLPPCPLIRECGVHIVNASNCQTNEVGAGHGAGHGATRQRREDIPESEYTEHGVELLPFSPHNFPSFTPSTERPSSHVYWRHEQHLFIGDAGDTSSPHSPATRATLPTRNYRRREREELPRKRQELPRKRQERQERLRKLLREQP